MTGIRIFTDPKKVCTQENSSHHQKGMKQSRAGRWLKAILPFLDAEKDNKKTQRKLSPGSPHCSTLPGPYCEEMLRLLYMVQQTHPGKSLLWITGSTQE